LEWLVLPLPRLALRHRGTYSQGPGAGTEEAGIITVSPVERMFRIYDRTEITDDCFESISGQRD